MAGEYCIRRTVCLSISGDVGYWPDAQETPLATDKGLQVGEKFFWR